MGNVSDTPIIVTSIVVITYEHHLCPRLQRKVEVRWIVVFREVTIRFCAEGIGFCGKFTKLVFVIAFRHSVMCCQSNIITTFLWLERWVISFVEALEVICRHFPLSYIIK